MNTLLKASVEEVDAEQHLNGTAEQIDEILGQFGIVEHEPTPQEVLLFTRLDIEQAVDNIFS